MSDNLQKQMPKLEIISQLKSLKARKLVLAEFSNDDQFCKAIREIVRNTINKNVKLSEQEKKRLRKYKKVIVALGNKRKDKKKTKALLQQTGTGIFLPIVVPLVATVIKELLSK
jgi:ribosomal protein L19